VGADAKSALKTKCDKILASAPAAPVQRLYEEFPMSKVQSAQGLPWFFIGMCGFVGLILASFSIGGIGMLLRAPRASADVEQNYEVQRNAAAEDRNNCETLESLLARP
jgi:hypothetical protein